MALGRGRLTDKGEIQPLPKRSSSSPLLLSFHWNCFGRSVIASPLADIQTSSYLTSSVLAPTCHFWNFCHNMFFSSDLCPFLFSLFPVVFPSMLSGLLLSPLRTPFSIGTFIYVALTTYCLDQCHSMDLSGMMEIFCPAVFKSIVTSHLWLITTKKLNF